MPAKSLLIYLKGITPTVVQPVLSECICTAVYSFFPSLYEKFPIEGFSFNNFESAESCAIPLILFKFSSKITTLPSLPKLIFFAIFSI